MFIVVQLFLCAQCGRYLKQFNKPLIILKCTSTANCPLVIREITVRKKKWLLLTELSCIFDKFPELPGWWGSGDPFHRSDLIQASKLLSTRNKGELLLSLFIGSLHWTADSSILFPMLLCSHVYELAFCVEVHPKMRTRKKKKGLKLPPGFLKWFC